MIRSIQQDLQQWRPVGRSSRVPYSPAPFPATTSGGLMNSEDLNFYKFYYILLNFITSYCLLSSHCSSHSLRSTRSAPQSTIRWHPLKKVYPCLPLSTIVYSWFSFFPLRIINLYQCFASSSNILTSPRLYDDMSARRHFPILSTDPPLRNSEPVHLISANLKGAAPGEANNGWGWQAGARWNRAAQELAGARWKRVAPGKRAGLR